MEKKISGNQLVDKKHLIRPRHHQVYKPSENLGLLIINKIKLLIVVGHFERMCNYIDFWYLKCIDNQSSNVLLDSEGSLSSTVPSEMIGTIVLFNEKVKNVLNY